VYRSDSVGITDTPEGEGRISPDVWRRILEQRHQSIDRLHRPYGPQREGRTRLYVGTFVTEKRDKAVHVTGDLKVNYRLKAGVREQTVGGATRRDSNERVTRDVATAREQKRGKREKNAHSAPDWLRHELHLCPCFRSRPPREAARFPMLRRGSHPKTPRRRGCASQIPRS
jgi:hypothetical protein